LNRKLEKCNWCDRPIPEELRFTNETTEKLNNQMAVEKKKHEEFMKRPNNTSSSDCGYFDLGVDLSSGFIDEL